MKKIIFLLAISAITYLSAGFYFKLYSIYAVLNKLKSLDYNVIISGYLFEQVAIISMGILTLLILISFFKLLISKKSKNVPSKYDIKNKSEPSKNSSYLTDSLISEIKKSVEHYFDTKVNDCGIIFKNDAKYSSFVSDVPFFKELDKVGYIVVPVFNNHHNIIINSFYKSWRYNHSPTRCLESWFDIDVANKKLNDQLKNITQLLKHIDKSTGNKSIVAISFTETPFNKDKSKNVDDFDTLKWTLENNEIDECGFAVIIF